MALILPNHALVLRAFATLANAAPSSTDLNIHLGYVKDFGVNGYVQALNGIFSEVSNTQLAQIFLKNSGLDTIDLEGDGNNDNLAIATLFLEANGANRVGAILDLVATMQKTDLAPAARFNANFDAAYAYATNPVNVGNRPFDASLELTLTVGQDKLVGTALDDYFKAYLQGNNNSFNSGDLLDGGAGNDTLYADINAKAEGFAITGETKGIENVLFRVQNDQADSGDNNIAGVGIIDAQRMKDVLNWENNNSRADLIIEDVRINNNQITKDITITMRETDPGHVDYGVYFDQNSLRNSTENASQMNLRVLDTYSTAQGKENLLDSTYKTFTFYASINGAAAVKQTFESAEMDAAKTLDDMVIAIQKAADAMYGAGAVSVTLGAEYTVKDSVTSNDVKGREIVVATKGSGEVVFSTDGAGSGWGQKGTTPAVSGQYASFTTGAVTTTDLVTSTVLLDYVGRGSNGGDLVIGGLSVGDTSTSKGVQRFEITVEDDSRLQTINSTNNTLREVTIKNGAQSRVNDAYHAVNKAGGLLSVIGADLELGKKAGWTQPTTGSDSDFALPGTVQGTTSAQHNEYGFSDVRLIDGSAMTGKLVFDAEITEASISKYLNLADTANNPAADNVTFDYKGGSNNDTMLVHIDSNVSVSQNTLTAREDFKFKIDGGAGNDTITVGIVTNGATNWYANQAQFDNVEIFGGAGNDTINTTSSGDFVINAGAGNDTVYVHNDGSKSIWAVSTDTTVTAPNGDLLGVPANSAPVFLANGKLTVIYSGPGIAAPTSGGVMGASVTGAVTVAGTGIGTKSYTNGLEVTVDIPTGENYAVTQYHINQAIKKAINEDAVLSKLLSATDGAGNSLIITSKVDGAHVASDLTFTVSRDALYTATDILTAYQKFSQDSTVTTLAAVDTIVGTNITNINLREGMVNDATAGGANNFLAGTDSALISDNIIDLGAGKDVLVLSTTIGGTAAASSNETVKFTASSGIDATIANFTVGDNATVFGADVLDFTQYLTSKISHSGSAASQARIATTLNGNADVEANSVTVLSSPVFTTTDTFAGLDAAKFKAAINSGAATYANITDTTLNALLDGTSYTDVNGNAAITTAVIAGVGKGVVLVENDLNKGEYKVFELTWNSAATGATSQDFTEVSLLGVVDFGASLTGLTGAANSLTDNLV